MPLSSTHGSSGIPTPTERPQWTCALATAASLVTVLVGAGYLIAWLSGTMGQRGFSGITLKTNTSLDLLLLGTAALLLTPRPNRQATRWVARACAILALAVALLTLCEYATGWDLGIDQLLAREPPGALGTIAPNRMGVPAVGSFILAGLATLLLCRRHRTEAALAQGLALAVCFIAMAGVLGYLYGTYALYSLPGITATAWPTAVALFALGLALLAARPGEGLMALVVADNPGGALLRRLLVPLVLLSVLLGWLRLQLERRGTYDTPFGTALLVSGFILVFGTLLFKVGQRLSRSVAAERSAEHSVRTSEAKFRAVFEQAAIGMGRVGFTDARWIDVNDAFCRMLGYSRQEFQATPWPQITHPDDVDLDLLPFRRMAAGELESYTVEKRFIHKRGHLVWARLTLSLVRNAQGRPDYEIAIIEDITERKQMELDLQDAHRSAEQAKVAAEDASRAKDHFLAVLSHELRTPLTPVVTAVSLLEDKPGLDGPTRESLEMIRRNVEMEARLIDDLLDVTRISRGKVELDRRPVMLCQVLRRAIEVVQPDLEARRLHFGVDLQDAPYIVDADPARLQQVFWNLLRNAIKFTPHGGCIGVRGRRGANGHVTLDILDSGEGIDPQALTRIFSPFEQAERRITRQFGGLGLGLTITKALVEMHGGTIEALSEGRGKGATFRVHLPLVAARTTPEPTPRKAPPRARPLRILLVEDHADTARVMRQLLTLDGHHVEWAEDAAAALDLARQNHFDLLISDLGLPDRSGLELLQEVRTRGAAFPAIALSGYGQEEDIRRSREAGFAAHLTKPTRPDRLTETIAAVTAGTPVPP